jgi:hypothetical protein
VRLSSDFKIQEFNPEAEKFFAKKYKSVINKSFITLVIPKAKQTKTEKALLKLLAAGKHCIYKTEVLVDKENTRLVAWEINMLLNNLKTPAGMILIKKSEGGSRETEVRRRE